MQIARPAQSLQVAVERGRQTIELTSGVDVVMHDVEVRSGIQAGAFERVEPIPAQPMAFSTTRPSTGPIVMPFIGGMGDAIAMLPVIEAVRRFTPHQSFIVSTTPGPAELFRMSPVVDTVVPYPLTIDQWRQFGSYVSMECVAQTEQPTGHGLSRTFAAALGVNIEDCSFPLRVPAGVGPSAEHRVVGIAVGPAGGVRTAPTRLIGGIVDELITRRVACVLLGEPDERMRIERSSPLFEDLRGRTPHVAELAVWVKSMNVVVSHDSFVMHLAGALGVPTVGLFAPTSQRIADAFDTVLPVRSGASCSPCHAIGSTCPLGHERCLAWDDPSLNSRAVAKKILDLLDLAARHAA